MPANLYEKFVRQLRPDPNDPGVLPRLDTGTTGLLPACLSPACLSVSVPPSPNPEVPGLLRNCYAIAV